MPARHWGRRRPRVRLGQLPDPGRLVDETIKSAAWRRRFMLRLGPGTKSSCTPQLDVATPLRPSRVSLNDGLSPLRKTRTKPSSDDDHFVSAAAGLRSPLRRKLVRSWTGAPSAGQAFWPFPPRRVASFQPQAGPLSFAALGLRPSAPFLQAKSARPSPGLRPSQGAALERRAFAGPGRRLLRRKDAPPWRWPRSPRRSCSPPKRPP
jgi:hypothetical protein